MSSILSTPRNEWCEWRFGLVTNGVDGILKVLQMLHLEW